MTSCLLCGPDRTGQVSLLQIVESFKIMVQLLETEASQVNDRSNKLRLQLDNVNEMKKTLEVEKKAAQERSDTYKQRFLEAQDAIKTLHEKNMKLSNYTKNLESQKKSSKEDQAKSFPFSTMHPGKDLSPGTRKFILAPDTYFNDSMQNQDVTYISSDEEDFQEERRPSKSPKRSQLIKKDKTPPKNNKTTLEDSFFAIPKNPVNPKTEKLGGRCKDEVDMDVTRMDVCDQLDVKEEITFSENLDETTLMSDHDHFDSIPPSPILSAGKEKRFGAFRAGLLSVPKYNVHMDDEEKSPSLLRGNVPFFSRLSNKQLNEDKMNGNEHPKEKFEKESQGWNDVRPPQDSLSLLRKKTQKAPDVMNEVQGRPGNTSLDDLFDKTDGDLETTTMLNNTTWNASDESEDDEEIDALLLEEMDNREGSYCVETNIPVSKNIVKLHGAGGNREVSRSPIPLQEDSFNIIPRKSKPTFKYQEVVRKKDDRQKLDGKACVQCEAYYSDLPEEEKIAKLKEVCRHKHVYVPPSTPENFWEVDFPSTEECKRRGYIIDHADLSTQAKQQQIPKLRRKRPLESNFRPNNK